MKNQTVYIKYIIWRINIDAIDGILYSTLE